MTLQKATRMMTTERSRPCAITVMVVGLAAGTKAVIKVEFKDRAPVFFEEWAPGARAVVAGGQA